MEEDRLVSVWRDPMDRIVIRIGDALLVVSNEEGRQIAHALIREVRIVYEENT